MKRGFTLLELLISCVLLVTILGLLAMVVDRVNSQRNEGSRRVTTLTRGRAALDILADDLQNVIGTNLQVLADGTVSDWSYDNENHALRLSRSVRQRQITPGSATNPPAEILDYHVVETNVNGLTTYYLARGHRPYEANQTPDSVQTEAPWTREWTYGNPLDGDTVTNIVSGSDQTLLPPAQQGDTILLPVNTVSSDHIYDWNTSTGVRLSVTPGDGTNRHRVVATVTQTNTFTRLSVQTNQPPVTPAGFWPEFPRMTIATGYQAVTLIGTTNLWQGAMLFTNTVPVQATNQSATAALPTGGATQAMEQVTFANVTNSWQVMVRTNDIDVLTNTFVGVSLGFTNFPAPVIGNAWVHPGSTNDGVRVEHAAFDWARWDTTPTPIPAFSNRPWRVHAITNSHGFPPTGTNAPPELADLPLALTSTQVFWFAQHPEAWETFATNTTRVTAQDTLTPLLTQNYWRASETISTNAVTPTQHIQTIWQRVTQITVSVIETQIPADLMSTGTHEYATSDTRDWVDTISNEETHWVSHTLIEDFEGATVDVFSLWLDVGSKTQIDLKYVPGTPITQYQGQPAIDGDLGSPDEIVDGVVAFYAKVLAFKQDAEDEPWRLVAWDPDDPEARSAPVCVDIQLELIDPAVARRAAQMTDTAGKEFVRRQTVRLFRRIPLQTHNRWREP